MNPRKNLMHVGVLIFAIAALAAAPAQAATGHHSRPPGDPSDVVSRYLRSHATQANERAGSLGVNSAVATPDVFERYASAHPYSVGLTLAPTAAPGGFRWSDYGAGVGTGIVAVLLIAGGLLATPMGRRQLSQPAVGG